MTLHTSQAPAHALWQHTLSTQNVDVHSWLPPQATPEPLSAWQLEPLQKLPTTHCASSVQVLGQLPPTPSHRNGEHDGLTPAEPDAIAVQVPGVTLHTSQPPEHALEQQNPSAQLPVAQLPAPPGRPGW